jgi:ABC-type lipoprotein export system ATPase subunit
MITKLTIKNFKRLSLAEVELGHTSLFVGPNNSGKTTALQALSLWDIGLRKWAEKRRHGTAKERTGVTINRRDLLSIPIPSARLLWHDMKVRQKNENITFTIIVDGIHNNTPWRFPLEFDYANEEVLFCRALDYPKDSAAKEYLLNAALSQSFVYLPPMSGLSAQEFRKESGEINVLIGQGRTAEVLRNLCHRIHLKEKPDAWRDLSERISTLFGVNIIPPEYIAERSELVMRYREKTGIELDLSVAGRGLQQTILLLAYLYDNPNSILLLDEPDAHLEVLRQREIYNIITETASDQKSQVVAASHSEVVLNEAAERDVVVAFVGTPHRIDSRQRLTQASKALNKIRFDQYYIAETYGWMLYLEGSTDLAILVALAKKLRHPAVSVLAQAPVDYVKNNVPQLARDNFFGLREAKPNLRGIAIFDRLDRVLQSSDEFRELTWAKRELENYIVSREVLLRFASSGHENDLFGDATARKQRECMAACIKELEDALHVTGKPSPWSPDIKVTDDFLDPLFRNYYNMLGINQLTYKRDYHQLSEFLELHEIDQEIREKLDAIMEVASSATTS